MSKQLICVVDDDRSMTRMLARAVSAAGFDVLCFGSAEEFLNSNHAADYSCLIVDVDLPGMNGLELQQHLNDSGQRAPVIFISGAATSEKRQRALKADAVAFLNKPFKIESLLAAIRSV